MLEFLVTIILAYNTALSHILGLSINFFTINIYIVNHNDRVFQLQVSEGCYNNNQGHILSQ